MAAGLSCSEACSQLGIEFFLGRPLGLVGDSRPPPCSTCRPAKPAVNFAATEMCRSGGAVTYYFLPLHPSVLVPGLDLQLTQAQGLGQVYSVVDVQRHHENLPHAAAGSSSSPVGGGQIFLLLEALLQTHQLQLREDGAAPAAFLALHRSIASRL